MKYLMIDGAGYPETSEEFHPAMEALFSVAYTLKFALKQAPGAGDFKVMPPEGVWWMEGDGEWDMKRPDDWRWTLLSAVPDFVDAKAVREARKSCAGKGKGGPLLGRIRLKAWKEGRVAQMLHIGPYEQEEETIAKIMAFIEENGYAVNGRHHEIYLSDPRRVAPEKLKTILRYPVKKKAGGRRR